MFWGCQHRMMSLFLTAEVRGCEGWRAQGWEWHLLRGSPCTGAGLDLWITTSKCHRRAPAETHLCCLSVCVCVLQKSCSRNYFEFYLSLRDYFWLLCETSQVMPGLCRVAGWHRGHESQEGLRRRQSCPLEGSCFILKKTFYMKISPRHFFPTPCLKFPNFVWESGECSSMDTE